MEEEKSQVSHIRMLLTDLLMGGIFLILFGFALWLIWVTYFREHFDTGIIENSKIVSIEKLELSGMDKKDHFHNLDESLFKNTNSSSLCIKCHDSYAHSKAKEVRAFLNAHAYFMACEVCHLENKNLSHFTFRWFDDRRGSIKEDFPTKLEAKIVPVEITGRTIVRLDVSKDRKFIEKYLSLEDKLDKIEKENANVRIHKHVSDSAIMCDECHTSEEESYLPLKELYYSKQRIAELAGIEVIGMINKYKNFYLPNLTHDKTF